MSTMNATLFSLHKRERHRRNRDGRQPVHQSACWPNFLSSRRSTRHAGTRTAPRPGESPSRRGSTWFTAASMIRVCLTRSSSGGEIVYHLAAWLANTDMPDMTSIYVINSLVPAMLAKLCAEEAEKADLYLVAQRLFRRALRGTHRGGPLCVPPRFRRVDRGGQERVLRPGQALLAGAMAFECRRRGGHRRDSPQAASALRTEDLRQGRLPHLLPDEAAGGTIRARPWRHGACG